MAAPLGRSDDPLGVGVEGKYRIQVGGRVHDYASLESRQRESCRRGDDSGRGKIPTLADEGARPTTQDVQLDHADLEPPLICYDGDAPLGLKPGGFLGHARRIRPR